MESLANKTVQTLAENHLTVATAESCTGGLVAAKLTSVSGSSAVISFSMVTYSNEVKIQKLGVKRETVEAFGAISEQTAREMAINIREKADADIGVGITGVAGPNTSEDKPVGLVFIAVADKQKVYIEKLNLTAKTRDEVREDAAKTALELITEAALRLKGVSDAKK